MESSRYVEKSPWGQLWIAQFSSGAESSLFQVFPGLESNDILTFDLDLLTGPRVISHTGLPVLGFESAKPDQRNSAVAFFQTIGYTIEE